MKAILGKFLPKKKLFAILAVALAVSAASGAAAVYVGRDGMLSKVTAASPSGVACTAVRTMIFNRDGQRWVRQQIKTDRIDGDQRVKTALRVVGALAKKEHADLYQVVVLDAAGPEERAAVRGAAIGADVLFAPDPAKVAGMETPFRARYNDATANRAGMFYGSTIVLGMDDVKAAMTAMTEHEGCAEPVTEASAEGAKPVEEAAATPAAAH